MKDDKKGFWDQPANFWIGAGLVAEAPVAIVGAFLPEDGCNSILGWLTDCPPSVWFLVGACILLFFIIAWIGYQLRLGAKT